MSLVSKTLGDLFKIGSSKRILKADWKTSGVPFYRGREITALSKFGYIDNDLFISEEHYSELSETYGVPSAGDILITAIGTIGNTYIVKENDKFYFKDASVLWLSEGRDIDSKFMDYWFKSEDFFKQLDIGSGATVDTLSISKLKSLEITAPPLSVQKQIVEKLDAAFADIDKAISATEKNIENAEALFSSKLKETFSQSESDDPTLGSLLKITSSKRIYKSDYVQKGIPFYRTKEIKELANGRKINTELFIDKDKFSKLREKYGAPLKGDVLITAIGTIGEVYVVESSDEFYFKDGNVLWLKGLTDIDPYFLKFSLVSFVNDLNKMSHGAAYSALPIQKLKSFKIKLPPLREQSQIVTRLDNLKRKTVRLNSIYLKKMAELHALKSSILNQAFSGELTKDAA